MEKVRAGALYDPRRLRPDVPAALVDVFARALAPDPDARTPSAAAFLDDLQRAMGPLGLTDGAREIGAVVRGRMTPATSSAVPVDLE